MFKRYLALEANAGSGKTFSLVSRYIYLLFLGVSPKKILAITFTRKATKEMLERILVALNSPLQSKEVREVQKELHLSDDEVVERAKQGLSEMNISTINISTIDSFANTILRKFAHHFNILPNYQIVDEIDIRKFQNYFYKHLYSSKYLSEMFQIEKLSNTKLDRVLEHLHYLYPNEVSIRKIAKKYQEVEIGVEVIEELESEILEHGQYIASSILKYAKLSNSGRKNLEFSNLEELLEKSWIEKDCLSQFRFFAKPLREIENSDEVENSFQILKEYINIYLQKKSNLIIKSLLNLFRFYIEIREKFVKLEKRLSFDDIDHFLIKEQIDIDFIYFRIDSKIEHLLIDEFQDTSIVQWKILEPLIDDILSGGSSEDKTFFYVGDKKQSLYRFRGGFSQLFDYLQSKYSQISKDTLSKNYRSKEAIVQYVNSVFGTSQKIGKEEQKGGYICFDEVDNTILASVERAIELFLCGASPSSIAILVSTNREVDKVRRELQNRGIEVIHESNLPLIQYPKVQAIIYLLKYIYYIKEKHADFYLKHFQTLIGIDPKENYYLDVKLENLSLYEMVTRIIHHFQISDPNTLQFLETISKFRDIDEFIHNYHLISQSTTNTNQNGIRVMTIHKSKGLEFDHVIFADFPKSQRGRTSKLLLRYGEDLEVEEIGWKGLASQQLQEAERELEKRDDTNRIYVAFTRAKRTLSIFKLKKNSTLSELGIASTPQRGNLIQEIETISESPTPKEYRLDFQKRHYGYQNERATTEKEEMEEFDIDREWDSLQRIEFGTGLHATIEMMDSFDISSLEIAINNIGNRFPLVDTSDIRNRILNLINFPKFQEILENGSISKEVGYIYNGKQFYIDLLIHKSDEVVVCDFKSGKNRELHQKYIEQVSNYMRIVSETNTKDRKVSGYLIYVLHNQIEIEEVKPS